MNKPTRNLLIGLAITAVSGLVLTLLDMAAAESSSNLSIFLPIFLGMIAGCALQMSGNGKEIRIDDVCHQSSRRDVPAAGLGELPSWQRVVSEFRSETVK